MLTENLEDSYSVTRTIDGIPYFLALTDTAGQEEYRSVWAGTNLQCDAFLMVYDITVASTLPALDYYRELIDMEADRRVEENQLLLDDERERIARLQDRGLDQNPHSDPMVGLPPPIKMIAGNKCDLKESRVIPARQGLEYARRHGCGFMETSAWEVVNIEETFACT
jgi:GTPase KRas